MEFDKSKIEKFLALDDDAFKSKLAEAAKSSGISDPRFDRMLKDVRGVKKTLNGLTDRDYKKLQKTFGEDKIEEVIKRVSTDT
ncbi:hypothetical protein FACS1894219_05990 [Clostridia bacterium]|nr:hypothetical protein FACS1894219_05990 [Clostridia bacterium]